MLPSLSIRSRSGLARKMKAFSISRLWILLGLSLVVSAAKQVPVVDGVIGGVPTSTKEFAEDVIQPQVSGTPVAGKLRFVENTGVCGRCRRR